MPQIRNTKTEQRIRDALTELLPKYGIEGISVSTIARVAGINRGTFYAHYQDKYDLIDKQVDRISADLTEIALSVSLDERAASYEIIAKEGLIAACRYFKENQEFISALASQGSNSHFHERAKDMVRSIMERAAARRGRTLVFGSIPEDYGWEMLLSSITSVLWLWHAKGCPESPEEITEIVWVHKSHSPEELFA